MKELKLIRIGNLKLLSHDDIEPSKFKAILLGELLKTLNEYEKLTVMSPLFKSAIQKVSEQISTPVEVFPFHTHKKQLIDVTSWFESVLSD